MIQSLSKSIHESLGVSSAQLERIIQRAPNTYKVYEIPKKSGGHRIIAQPAKETKYIQNWLIKNIFTRLPIHASAAAYKEGASIKKNASTHKDNSYIAKFDFKDFFTSIKINDIVVLLHLHFSKEYGNEDIFKMAYISCIKHDMQPELCLSIGSPSSPILSNAVLFEFDSMVQEWCSQIGLTYTRYADDLTFSTNVKHLCRDIEPKIREIVDSLSHPKLTINNKKTIHLSKKFQRRITGLIINNLGEISLGRDRKREISALIHKYSLGVLLPEDTFRLQGLLGFAKDVEPAFIERMNKKYESNLINSIFSLRKEPTKT